MDAMAGGMNKRGSYGTMAERVARSRGDDPTERQALGVPGPPTALKHCWVENHLGRLPGLLLEWRQRPEWEARVVHPVLDQDGWIVVEEWIPAGWLQPVEDDSAPSS